MAGDQAKSRVPRVGIPACVKPLGKEMFHAAGRKYLTAVAKGAGCWPIVIPSLGDWYNDNLEWPEALFDVVDGVLLTGSPSNIEPACYGSDAPAAEPDALDPKRDSTVLSFLRGTVEAGIPLLAVCRGLQEMNVAFGGTLHQQVHELSGRGRHVPSLDNPLEQIYASAHEVRLASGGQLRKIAENRDTIWVNSVHSQAVDCVAPGLEVEGIASDGTVEALRVVDAPGFALAVQWHPEWRFWDDPVSSALFAAFGKAVRAHAEIRAEGDR